jgi:hypothetical protein
LDPKATHKRPLRHRRTGLQVFKDVDERLGTVLDVAIEDLAARFVHDRNLTPLAVNIDTGVNHYWASLPELALLDSREAYVAP